VSLLQIDLSAMQLPFLFHRCRGALVVMAIREQSCKRIKAASDLHHAINFDQIAALDKGNLD